MQIGQSFADVPPEGVDTALSPEMLLNFPVFGIALGVCFLLNLLSALIPARRASNRAIIYSLNAKQ
jgi:putative ABC transport system permease protein